MPDSPPSLDTAPAQTAPTGAAREAADSRRPSRRSLRELARSLASWGRSHPTWVDGAVAVAVLLANVLLAHLVLHQYGGQYEDSLSSVPALVSRYPLALAAWLWGAAALTLRQRHPVVAWLTLLLMYPLYEQLLLLVHQPPTHEEFRLAAFAIQILVQVGVPITLGTVAARSHLLTTWSAWGMTMIVFYLTIVLVEGYAVVSGETQQAVIRTMLVLLVTVLTGLNLRSSRLRITEVEMRSSRLALAREQEALLAASNERSRIAREMHDVVAHSLAVMITMADGAVATIDRDPATAKKALEMLAETGRGALADTRRLVGVLREDPALAQAGQAPGGERASVGASPAPAGEASEAGRTPPPPDSHPTRGGGEAEHDSPRAALGGRGSAQADPPQERAPQVRDLPVPEFAPPGTVAAVEPSAPIEDLRREATDRDSDSSSGSTPLAPAPEQADIAGLVERFRAAGVPVDYTWSGKALPEDKALQLTVFRIAQEALTNILRYAPTSPRVAVTVERHTGTAVLTVDNEGAPGARPMHGSGKGLIGMRERASVYGGTVQAGPTATGWRVRAVLRWDEKNEGTLSWQMPL